MKKNFFFLLAFFLSACGAPSTQVVSPPAEEMAATSTPVVEGPTPFPTFTLTPAPTPFTSKISEKDGMTQVYVPAGEVYMGGLDVLLENDEIPAHRVKLNGFWVDQVEVTNGMYLLCVNAGVCRQPVKLNSDNHADYFVNPEFKDYPVVYISWADANTYCQWAGRRLPTEAEWERAARGDDMRTYPWGDEPPNANNSNSLNIVGDTTRVGSYPEGMSPFGALDMAGNVWEWVADYYNARYYAESPSETPAGPENGGINHLRVIRGGSYQDDLITMRLANRGYEVGPNPSALPYEEAYYGQSSVRIGFRCVE